MTPRLAVHMWSLYDLAEADYPAALDIVGEAGYGAVETMGFGRLDVAEGSRLLQERGLSICAAHVPFPSSPADDATIEAYAALDCGTLVWSLEPEEFATRDAMLHGVKRINAAAERAARFGMAIGYHNHFAEFSHRYPAADPDGELAYDALRLALDPRVVLELDTYWPRVAHADPAEIARHALTGGAEIRLIHVKDGPGTGMEDMMTPVTADSPGVIPTLEAVPDLSWAVVELDRTRGSIAAALSVSRQNLLATGLVGDRSR